MNSTPGAGRATVPAGLLIALLAILLAGCATATIPTPKPMPADAPTAMPGAVPGNMSGVLPPAGTDPAADAPTSDGAGDSWRIDEASSALRLRVRRGGSLARLGHNHVLVAPLRGSVRVAGEHVTGLELATEPGRWRVDEPHERGRAGVGFESTPDATAIAGTRANMLSAALLDAARHPAIVIIGRGGPRDGEHLPLELELHLQGRVIPWSLVLHVTPAEHGWRGIGSTRLTHAQLGLTPFSALGGALTVEPGIDVEIDLLLVR